MAERFEAVGQHLGGREHVLRNWPPLLLIAVEQVGRRTATMDESQLPGEVVRVLDAGIHALPAHRAVDMHGVARQKDSFVAIVARGPVVIRKYARPAGEAV